jgi:hypothetical protein
MNHFKLQKSLIFTELLWMRPVFPEALNMTERPVFPIVIGINFLTYINFIKVDITKKAPAYAEALVLGGRPVSNRRPLEPQSSALTN